MSKIKCPKCGNDTESGKFCESCGGSLIDNLKEKGKVIIHGYEEAYAVNPDVQVYDGDNLITKLSKGETYEYFLDKDTTLTFKCSIRKAKQEVKKNAITEIRLMFDRFSGKLKTIVNEQIIGDDEETKKNNIQNQEKYEENVNKGKNKSLVWLVIGIVLFVIAILFL